MTTQIVQDEIKKVQTEYGIKTSFGDYVRVFCESGLVIDLELDNETMDYQVGDNIEYEITSGKGLTYDNRKPRGFKNSSFLEKKLN